MCLARDPHLPLLRKPTERPSASHVDDATAERLQHSCAVVAATHDRRMLGGLADPPHLNLDPKDLP